MAGRIAGITIEIGGDTTNLQKSLKGVDSQLKTTQSNLKDINKLLKLDPGNTELLRQKQKELEKAIGATKDRLEQLKQAQSQVKEGSAEWDALQREIIDTQNSLKSLEQQYKQFGSVASQQIKAVGQSLKDAGGKVEDWGQKLSGISGAAAAIGGVLLKLGYGAATSADDLNTLAKQTGFSTEQLQKFQYAADLIDVSLSDITGALKKFKGKLDPNNASLQALGVAVTDADGNLRNATDVFFDAVQALSQIENETERDQAAMELFGKSADSLAGIIDDGGAALREYGQQAEDLGLILGQDTLDSLNAANDTIDQMKAQISATMAVVGAQVLPVVQPILEKAGELISKVAAKLSQLNPEVMDTILKVAGVVAAVAPVLIIGGKIISGLGSLVSVIGAVVGVLGGPLTIAIAAVVAAGVLLYKNWDTIKEKASTLASAVVEKFESMKAKIKSIVDTIKGFFTGEWKMPKIKLPHFSISPAGWAFGDLLKGVIPKLSINWYKKAYDNPVMFTSPTVMATPNGYKGFGDGSGAEIVMGLDKLREVVGSQNVTVQVVLEGDARNLFRQVQRTNTVRTRATNYNALAGA